MNSFAGQCSIMKKIQKTEAVIKELYKRLDVAENEFRSKQIPNNKRQEIMTEINELRQLLKDNEKQLSQLHRHNSKTFAFAAALCFVVFTTYALYILVQGRDF